MITQNRLKSKVLWVSIAAFIALIAKTYFNYDIPGWDLIVESLLTILTMLGIINNPTSKNTP